MDVVGESRPVLQRQFALVIGELCVSGFARRRWDCGGTYHRIGEGRRDSHRHPPNQPLQELTSFASDQAADQPAIKLGHVQTDHSPQHQKDAVTDDQSELLASPSWDADLEQTQEVLEELAIQLNLLSASGFTLTGPCPSLALCFAPDRSCFLLGDGVADAVYEGDEEREVDGPRYARTILEVQRGKVIDEGLDRSTGKTLLRPRFREDGHAYRGRSIRGAGVSNVTIALQR